MSSKRLNLSDFKLKQQNLDEKKVSNLMGNVLGTCHDTTGGFSICGNGYNGYRVDD